VAFSVKPNRQRSKTGPDVATRKHRIKQERCGGDVEVKQLINGKSIKSLTRREEVGVAEGSAESLRIEGFPPSQHPNGVNRLKMDGRKDELNE
jgi:hypothetical protein